VPTVPFQHHEAFVLNFFIGGKAMLTLGTFATAANGRAFTRGTRVNNPIFLATALGTTHKTTANCGWQFLTHKPLWRQGMLLIKLKASCLRFFSG
jgi:hypothetical protein